MSVKTASELVTRAMRAAIKETISPANQDIEMPSERRPLSEAGKISRQFGQELHERVNAYTGSVDDFGAPDNMVDNWRLQFSRRANDFKPANGVDAGSRRQGQR